jgi:hypothetical protein
MSTILEKLDQDIAETIKQIRDLKQDVESAKQSGDPMPLMKAQSALQSAVSQLSVLQYRRKCETPAGSSGGGVTPGIFHGSNS